MKIKLNFLLLLSATGLAFIIAAYFLIEPFLLVPVFGVNLIIFAMILSYKFDSIGNKCNEHKDWLNRNT